MFVDLYCSVSVIFSLSVNSVFSFYVLPFIVNKDVYILMYSIRGSVVAGCINQITIWGSVFCSSHKLSQTHACPITEIVQLLPSLTTLPAKSRHGSDHTSLSRLMSRYVSKVFQLTFPDSSASSSFAAPYGRALFVFFFYVLPFVVNKNVYIAAPQGYTSRIKASHHNVTAPANDRWTSDRELHGLVSQLQTMRCRSHQRRCRHSPLVTCCVRLLNT